MSDTSHPDNSADELGDLPTVVTAKGEIVVSVQAEGLLVSGDPAEVEAVHRPNPRCHRAGGGHRRNRQGDAR